MNESRLPVGDPLVDRFGRTVKQKPWQRPSDRTPRGHHYVAIVPIYSTSRRQTAHERRLAHAKWRHALMVKASAEGRKSWRWLHERVRPVKAARKAR